MNDALRNYSNQLKLKRLKRENLDKQIHSQVYPSLHSMNTWDDSMSNRDLSTAADAEKCITTSFYDDAYTSLVHSLFELKHLVIDVHAKVELFEVDCLTTKAIYDALLQARNLHKTKYESALKKLKA